MESALRLGQLVVLISLIPAMLLVVKHRKRTAVLRPQIDAIHNGPTIPVDGPISIHAYRVAKTYFTYTSSHNQVLSVITATNGRLTVTHPSGKVLFDKPSQSIKPKVVQGYVKLGPLFMLSAFHPQHRHQVPMDQRILAENALAWRIHLAINGYQVID